MSSKELLYQEIQDLTEAQARRLLAVVRRLVQDEKTNTTWVRLANNPSIELPERGVKRVRQFEPIRSSGIPASQMLIEDRR